MNDRFGSTARDFAAGIVTREGGTPEDVRELSLDWQRCVGQVLRGRVPVR